MVGCGQHSQLALRWHPRLCCPVQVQVADGAQGGCPPLAAYVVEGGQHAAAGGAVGVSAQHNPQHQVCKGLLLLLLVLLALLLVRRVLRFTCTGGSVAPMGVKQFMAGDPCAACSRASLGQRRPGCMLSTPCARLAPHLRRLGYDRATRTVKSCRSRCLQCRLAAQRRDLLVTGAHAGASHMHIRVSRLESSPVLEREVAEGKLGLSLIRLSLTAYWMTTLWRMPTGRLSTTLTCETMKPARLGDSSCTQAC
jgi:hypothetical protein